MDPLTALAASGLRARMESLDLLANNVANASTGGYKADREFYSLYVAPEAADNDPLASMPVIERQWTDYAQGALHPTGNPLDVALEGKGFFAVDGPSGPLYTRNGSFRLAADGTLGTQDGYPVRSRQGMPLVLDGSRNIEIAKDGTVTRTATSSANSNLPISPAVPGWPSKGPTISGLPIPNCSPLRPRPRPLRRDNWRTPTPAPRRPRFAWSACCASLKCCRRP